MVLIEAALKSCGASMDDLTNVNGTLTTHPNFTTVGDDEAKHLLSHSFIMLCSSVPKR